MCVHMCTSVHTTEWICTHVNVHVWECMDVCMHCVGCEVCVHGVCICECAGT